MIEFKHHALTLGAERTVHFLQEIWDDIVAFFMKPNNILAMIIWIIVILLGAKLIIVIGNKLIRRTLHRRIAKNPDSLAAKKSETLIAMLSSILRYTIYFFAVSGILGVIGLGTTVGSMLATAGIGGIAIGLGAQAFIKDVVSGFFLLLEDQFAVGDMVKAAGLTGTVESISLRTTRIRLFHNEIATVPNGQIDIVINYTRDQYLLNYEISIAYGQSAEKAQALMEKIGAAYAEECKDILSGPIPVGVVKVEPTRITLRMNFYVEPKAQWSVEWALNRRVTEAFQKEGIILPDYDSFVVVNNNQA